MSTYLDELSQRAKMTGKDLAEAKLVGLLMNSGSQDAGIAPCRAVVDLGLRPDHFSHPSHQRYYSAICTLFDTGRPFGYLDVYDYLHDPHLALDLAELMETQAPIAQNPIAFANEILAMVAEKHTAEVAGLLRDEMRRGAGTTPAEVGEKVMRTLIGLVTDQPVRIGGAAPMPEVMDALAARIERNVAERGSGINTKIPTGLDAFDSRYGGLERCGLHIIGARAGIGKTTYALNVAANAGHSGSKVLYFTREMDKVELGARLLSRVSRVGVADILHRDASEDQLDRIIGGMERLAPLQFKIDDRSMPDWASVKSRIVSEKRLNGLDLVVIDYVQQLTLTAEKRWVNRVEEMKTITSEIKNLSVEHGIAILVVSQLNREKNDGYSPPSGSQLKESGSLEQDADTVVMLHVKEEDDERDYYLWVEKHRHAQDKILMGLQIGREFGAMQTDGEKSRGELKPKPKVSMSSMAGRK